jgi:hydroxyacylglutathione hydrolase
MQRRKYLFPNVIELNYQAGRKLGVNVYLIDGGDEFAIIDIGYEESVLEVVELVRQMDFNLSHCKYLIATHADADHVQGIARAKELFKSRVAAHPLSIAAIESGDVETTFARITAQNIDMPMPPCKVDVVINDGDVLEIGKVQLEVWSTPGHTPGQLSFKTGDLLFVGDNIYKDGCVGVIDAHHGSSLPDFIASIKRIRADSSPFLLPSHGPAFRRDDKLLKKTIDRLTQYQHMADFGTCAVDWPLLDEWEQDVLSGKLPKF